MNIKKIVKSLIPKGLFERIEPTWHLIEAVFANIRYGFPARNMHVIGVTGTNGKTTTTFLIYKILLEAGYKVAMQSTVAYGVGDDLKPQIEHMTTERSSILQRRLRDFRRAGAEWVVLEISSHSLAQHRNWGPPYEIAVMTNVTYEHLDYHKTFENYIEAKRQLFVMAAKHGRRFGVVNADDLNAAKFINSIPRSVSYGIKSGQLIARNIKLAVDHSTYIAEIDSDKYNIRINVPGDFNISNSLAAIAVGREIGLTKRQIEDGIAALKNVEGRMNVLDVGQKFKVIIDFASTPDAFEQALRNIRPTTKGKLVAVFGSAGRRDESKRAIQGEIAGRYCDELVLTEEDNRDADGTKILNQIADGAKKAGKTIDKDMFLIPNRKEAIEFAMNRVKSVDDTVVLLGKGHEKTIEQADGVHEWNESQIATKILKSLQK